VNAPQLVKRAEAEHALRKAAELGHAYATLMLAVLLDRGDTVKRDPADAIHWAERAVANPSKDVQVADMQVLLGRLQVKSSDPAERARGIALLEKLAEAGRSDARTELAIAIRASDPARARALLEQALSGYAGGAIPPLADMLIKGEGGPANPKRTVSLLAGRRASDVPGVFDVANALDRQNIPVELIVTFDATSPQPVPKNVLHFVNFYQENGFGKRVSPGPGFQGELTNIDLTADMGLSHTTIEKSPRLHAVVMQKIADVVKKDLAKRMAASKAKPNPRKSKPVTGRGEPPAEDRPTSHVIAATSMRGS
jgi:hypothetical protein